MNKEYMNTDLSTVPIDNNATKNLDLMAELLESTFASLIANGEYDKVIKFLESIKLPDSNRLI